MKDRNYEYWLAGPGEACVLKNRAILVEYLDRTKKLWVKTALEANSLSIENAGLKEEIKKLKNEIKELKEVNSDLTEENSELWRNA